MARPERHDVDYFPFFVKRGRTLNILQSKFGLEGIGFFTNLLRFLSLAPDHYYCIKSEEDRLNFFAEIGVREETKGMEMIETMVKTGKLDRELWENHRVIASEAFLESLKEAYKRRLNEIITIDEISAKFKNCNNNHVSVNIMSAETELLDTETELLSKKGDSNPQSKVKESKEEQSKFVGDSDESPQPLKDATKPEKLFLEIWQHTPDVFNVVGRIESHKEWANFWAITPLTTEQVKTALDNFIQDVRCGVIEQRYVPTKPDRFVLNGWLTKCRQRFKGKETSANRTPHRIAADNISPDKLDEYFS